MSSPLARVGRMVRSAGHFVLFGAACAAIGMSGCQAAQKTDAKSESSASWLAGVDRWHWLTPPPPPPPPIESVVLRGDRLEPVTRPAEGTATADLAGAHVLYRDGKFSEAERIFHRVAGNTKNPPAIAEEARYYEAECLRRQAHYPKAADTYAKMLTDFPSGAFREQAVQHMYEIANYWLDDTRKEMGEYKEEREGKRWVVWPEFVHFENTKPLLDEEGRALEKLEQVRYNDMTGPLADKALFLAGSVKFYRKEYKEADFLYSQIVEMHPNSPYAEQALELAIISKQLSTGGAAYDGRKVAEARKLVDTAERSYPVLAHKKGEFLNRQLFSITMQQAEKDYQVAEFYRRTGHPCSAYFYYEIVRRRYPGTVYFNLASHQIEHLRAKLEKLQQGETPATGLFGLFSGGSLIPGVGPGLLPSGLSSNQMPPSTRR